LVIVTTAGHCLPFFPRCHGASYIAERTYKKLLAPLGGQPSIWCECCFIDPQLTLLSSARLITRF
jgi:hypothetical protein